MIVVEVGQAHDGSLGAAHAFIDVAASVGADGVKFQTHIAEAESLPTEPWRIRFSPQDETRFDYWRRMEFSKEHWRGLYQHTKEAGMSFVSSPFSLEAVDLLNETGIDIWKVASGEVANDILLKRLAGDGRPVVLSSGMSSFEELDHAVEVAGSQNSAVTLLQCTTAYPCPPERWGLNQIGVLRERYGLPTGFSDHSGTIFAGLAAATMGIELLEVHVTLSREAFGPDVVASLTPDELVLLVNGIRSIETSIDHPVDKDEMASEMDDLRTIFTRSLVATTDLDAGSILEASDISAKKPAGGIPPDRIDDLIGRKLLRRVQRNDVFSFDDFGGDGG